MWNRKAWHRTGPGLTIALEIQLPKFVHSTDEAYVVSVDSKSVRGRVRVHGGGCL